MSDRHQLTKNFPENLTTGLQETFLSELETKAESFRSTNDPERLMIGLARKQTSEVHTMFDTDLAMYLQSDPSLGLIDTYSPPLGDLENIFEIIRTNLFYRLWDVGAEWLSLRETGGFA